MNDIERLMAIYNSFTLQQKTVVEVLAVLYEKTARTHIVNCLRKLRIRDPEGNIFTFNKLSTVIDEMVMAGVIVVSPNYLKCSRMLTEPICRQLVEEGRFKTISMIVSEALYSKLKWVEQYPYEYEQLLRELRIGFYQGKTEYIRNILEQNQDKFFNKIYKEHPFTLILKNSFDTGWFIRHLPRDLLMDVLAAIVSDAAHHLLPIGIEAFALLQECIGILPPDKLSYHIRLVMCEQLILKGRFEEACEYVEKLEKVEALNLKGFLAFITGKNQEALMNYELSFNLLKKATRKHKVYFNDLGGLFSIPALLKGGLPEHIQKAKDYCIIGAADEKNRFKEGYEILKWLIKSRSEDPQFSNFITNQDLPFEITNAFTNMIQIFTLYWTDKKKAVKAQKFLKKIHDRAKAADYAWFQAESTELLSHLIKTSSHYKTQAAMIRESTGMITITNLVEPKERWQHVINALINLKKGGTTLNESQKAARMIWLFNFNAKKQTWDLAPREQRRTINGYWSKGRKIALKRLRNEPHSFDFMSPHDIKICSYIKEQFESNWRRHSEVYYYFTPGVLTAMVGHPLIFWEDAPQTQLEVMKGQAEIIISEQPGDKYEVAFSHAFDSEKKIQIVKESPTCIKIIEIDEEVQRIAQILGKGITIPQTAKDKIMEAIDSISSIVTVHSELDGSVRGIDFVEAHTTPHLHLLPFGQGLKIDLYNRPFGKDGPYFKPGEGAVSVISEIKDERIQTRRDLEQERQIADHTVTACPALSALNYFEENHYEWKVEEPAECLEILLQLQEMEDAVIIEWPEGESFKIKQKANLNQLFLSINKQEDWFSISGELKLDRDLMFTMQEILNLSEDSTGRFIRLKDGQFLALTKEFKKRLDEIKASTNMVGNTLQMHPLAALSLDDLKEQIGGLDGDIHWKKRLNKMQTARNLKPEVPTTLKAEMRDYQVEGFKWLARLAHWGVGACLADDMGLGKTLQTLSVILLNADKGPSLAVAPASVCLNWFTEVQHFTPTMNAIVFGNRNREKIISELKPYDLLIVSYGLLQQQKSADMLTKINFQTIVLDEAQAIKNFTTKRSRAAMNLQGKFKMMTTGTPIENHLGELWNLFRFINPGFLGSFKNFNAKFAVPIEKHHACKPRHQLKKIIQPFILRRLKSQVLEELPPRTDVLLQVELSSQEMAVYEALRRQAIENIDSSGHEGGKPMQIMAEIMRLRRACCNTRLVKLDAEFPSSKLTIFNEVVEELISSKHKALVFSQFVGHLSIIREQIEKNKISYQYLDGSTSQKERKKRVDAFQRGEGDLFLISLKAGGLGLNLTAADYVIHMDPWWNPAVEDQASDRAHRIGQTRPVTVYRLVAKHTIEEKIVALHQKKRDLADSLLDGADMSGKMSSDELFQLIREN